MNKEKIKELKKLRQDFWHHEKRKEYQLADEVLHTIANHYLDWLIEQAERVQEWRDIAKWQNDEKLKMEKIALEYEKQNKRYREAIERALDESGWGDEGNALHKMISILAKALEESE